MKQVCYNKKMENNNENNNMSANEKMFFELIILFYQMEYLLKNNNSLLADKIAEGDVTSSTVAFNNSIMISNVKKLLKDYPELKKYSKSPNFEKNLTNLFQQITKNNFTENPQKNKPKESDEEETNEVFEVENDTDKMVN